MSELGAQTGLIRFTTAVNARFYMKDLYMLIV